MDELKYISKISDNKTKSLASFPSLESSLESLKIASRSISTDSFSTTIELSTTQSTSTSALRPALPTSEHFTKLRFLSACSIFVSFSCSLFSPLSLIVVGSFLFLSFPFLSSLFRVSPCLFLLLSLSSHLLLLTLLCLSLSVHPSHNKTWIVFLNSSLSLWEEDTLTFSSSRQIRTCASLSDP